MSRQTSNTSRMKSSGTRAWNRSLIEFTNTTRELRHRRGSSSACGCTVDAEAGAGGARVAVVLVLRRAHRLEPLGQRHRVAVVAAGGDAVAAGDGVPGGLGPLDRRSICHRGLLTCGFLTAIVTYAGPAMCRMIQMRLMCRK